MISVNIHMKITSIDQIRHQIRILRIRLHLDIHFPKKSHFKEPHVSHIRFRNRSSYKEKQNERNRRFHRRHQIDLVSSDYESAIRYSKFLLHHTAFSFEISHTNCANKSFIDIHHALFHCASIHFAFAFHGVMPYTFAQWLHSPQRIHSPP